MDNQILKYISLHHLMTLATVVNNQPHCASVFYVFLPDEKLLIFKSNKETKHIQDALVNPNVASTIATEMKKINTLQGLQFGGRFWELKENLLEKAKQKYLQKFPMARLIKGNFWAMELSTIKMTDNRFGFGKKLIWKKQ